MYSASVQVLYGVPKWTKPKYSMKTKKYMYAYVLFLNIELCTCSLNFSCAHVLSVWAVYMFSQFVHMFSQFELCTYFLNLSYVYMFSPFELCAHVLSVCTCAQFKIERQHIYSIFFLYLSFCPLWHPMVLYQELLLTLDCTYNA